MKNQYNITITAYHFAERVNILSVLARLCRLISPDTIDRHRFRQIGQGYLTLRENRKGAQKCERKIKLKNVTNRIVKTKAIQIAIWEKNLYMYVIIMHDHP